jgi:hypothetical protein
MKAILRKTLLLLLCASLLFSSASVAVQAKTAARQSAPTILIEGMGADVYTDYGTPAQKTYSLYAGDNEKLLAAIWPVLTSLPTAKQKPAEAAKALYGIVDAMFGTFACDASGRPLIQGQKAQPSDDPTESGRAEGEPYQFRYDWRLDFMDTAKELSAYIDKVRKATGSAKVCLVCHSQGGAVVNAYLARYGSSKLESIVSYMSGASGLTMIDKLVTKQVHFDPELLTAWLNSTLRYDGGIPLFTAPVQALVSGAEFLGAIPLLCAIVNDVFGAVADEVYQQILLPLFLQWPNVWGFITNDRDYEAAKKALLDPLRHKALIKKIDNTHYNATMKASSLLLKAKKAGVKVSVVASYGWPQLPVVKNSATATDCLIDTHLQSYGASAAAFGKKLTPPVKESDRKYLSPDGTVSAATCLFPDSTWFIRGLQHLKFSQGSDLRSWLVSAKEQPTVRQNAAFPQFLRVDPWSGKIIPDA